MSFISLLCFRFYALDTLQLIPDRTRKKTRKKPVFKNDSSPLPVEKTGLNTTRKKTRRKTWNNNQKKSYFIRCSRTRHREKKAFITYVFLFYGTEKAKKARL